MQIKILVALSLFALSAHAADVIVPTDGPTGECLAARISTDKSSLNRKYDQLNCAVNKLPSAYAKCLYYADATVNFFTDRCNEASNGAYVYFNGKTHQVWRTSRISKSPITYSGTFKGNGVEVRIVPRKILERQTDGPELLGVTATVDVVIKYKNQSSTIKGIYVSGP